jgi:hypothetical protein
MIAIGRSQERPMATAGGGGPKKAVIDKRGSASAIIFAVR